ncbi:phage terminase large subunit [Actinomadura chibensis]|uniref:phage terminase large subunit n=1 Tax=Actinomadura chibensis TaxID=392828 RepID=UPI000AE04337|nr:phage terminase large subunit [Actinomadura chibensis]
MSGTTVVRYEPRGAARELFAAREDEVLLDGPAETGKSLAALYRLHLAALKHPGIKSLIVRKMAVSLSSTTLRTFDEKVAAAALAKGVVRWYGGSQREPASYKYRNGSRIVVGGMDQPTKIMSSEYDLAFCDEATDLTVDDLEAITTRLRNGVLPWQQVIAACNPRLPDALAEPAHGVRRDVAARLPARRQPPVHERRRHPTVEGAAYLAKLGALTGVRRLRLRDLNLGGRRRDHLRRDRRRRPPRRPVPHPRRLDPGGGRSTSGSCTRSFCSAGRRTVTAACTCTGRSSTPAASSRTTLGRSSPSSRSPSPASSRSRARSCAMPSRTAAAAGPSRGPAR